MDCNLILIAAAIAIEIPVAGIAAYFILKARKTVVSVVPAPTEPAATLRAEAAIHDLHQMRASCCPLYRDS